LAITISLRDEDDTFEIFQDNDKVYSIMKGIYISPFAESLFNDNKDLVDGLMMETRWKVLRLYVTSILMLVMCNAGIPVSFAFGPN
jgi:hypothetical protein